MRNFNHGLGTRSKYLVIFRKSARMIEPSKSSLYYPPFWDYYPAFRNYFFRNINVQVQNCQYVGDKRTAITSVTTKFLDCRIFTPRLNCDKHSGFRVVEIGFMDFEGKHTAESISSYMSFSSFRFFPPSKPICSLA